MLKPFTFFLIVLFYFPLNSDAQITAVPQEDTAWTLGSVFSLNFNQTGLSNWQGGGQSTMAFGSLLQADADYIKGSWSWINDLEAGYSILKQGRDGQWIKSDDRLQISSKAGRAFIKNFNVSFLLDFQTQMDVGYEFYTDSLGEDQRRVISRFMAPGYLLTALGAEYQPNKRFYLFLSPLTMKTTFVLDDTLAAREIYGNENGEMIRTEFGANFSSRLKLELMKNVTLQTSLNLFSNYQTPTLIDVDWQTMTVFKVNDFISANFSTHLIYDHDIEIETEDGTTGPATQFKEVLNIGITYEIKNRE
ncbi:MAG: DUF3078 domain-containing protein [Bacteroidia bacterium]